MAEGGRRRKASGLSWAPRFSTADEDGDLSQLFGSTPASVCVSSSEASALAEQTECLLSESRDVLDP